MCPRRDIGFFVILLFLFAAASTGPALACAKGQTVTLTDEIILIRDEGQYVDLTPLDGKIRPGCMISGVRVLGRLPSNCKEDGRFTASGIAEPHIMLGYFWLHASRLTCQ